MANLGGSSASLPFDITAEAVYVLPNHAEGKIINADQLRNRIVLVKRGNGIALGLKATTILKAQKDIKGILIIDDNQCDEDFRYCGYRAGNAFEGGFSSNDGSDVWEFVLKNNIPVLIVSARTGERFDRMMSLRSVSTKTMKAGNMTLLPPPGSTFGGHHEEVISEEEDDGYYDDYYYGDEEL